MDNILYYTEFPNLFWGNLSLDKPLTKPNPVKWNSFSNALKVNWIEPYIGLIKLNRINLNYCYYNKKFYFVEPLNWFGDGLVLYRLVYDFWVNDYLESGVRIKGILAKTNNIDLVSENINLTAPLIEGGNKLDYINLEHDEHDYSPTLNFKLTQAIPYISYFDPKALQGPFRELLKKASEEADRGEFDNSKLVVPALLYTSHKFKWWFWLLEGLAKYLKLNLKNLNVYEVTHTPGGYDYEANITNFNKDGEVIKRGKGGKYILVGTDSADWLSNTKLSVYKVKDLDFSLLKDVKWLGTDLDKNKTLEKKRLDSIDTEDLPVPAIDKSTIANYTLTPHEIHQTLNDNGQYRELRHFKIGEIKDYNQKTRNGEVLESGELEVLVGLKDLDQIKDWEVEPTQATFLEKHGVYKTLKVEKGEIVIPLSKYYLAREKAQPEALNLETGEKIRDNLKGYIDLTKIDDLKDKEKLENKTHIFGDNWYEREAIAVKPVYNENYYTYGYLFTERLSIENIQVLEQEHVYINVIKTITGGFETIKINPELLEAPTTNKPRPVEQWREYMNYVQEKGRTPNIFISSNYYAYITVPREGVIIPNIDAWEEGDWYEKIGLTGRGEKIYRVKLPAPHLLSKFLRDWDNPDKESKWVKCSFKRISQDKVKGTRITRYYKGLDYHLFIPHDNYPFYAYVKVYTPLLDADIFDADSNTKLEANYCCGYESDDVNTIYYYRTSKPVWTWNPPAYTCSSRYWRRKSKWGSSVAEVFSTNISIKSTSDVDFLSYLETWNVNGTRNPLYEPSAPYFGGYGSYSSDSFRVKDLIWGSYTEAILRPKSEEVWVTAKTSNLSGYRGYFPETIYNFYKPSTTYAKNKFYELNNYYNLWIDAQNIPLKVKGSSETARNPTELDFSKFNFTGISPSGIPDSIEWFNPLKDIGVNHNHFFDLVGTNYILCVKRDEADKLHYRLLLKDPDLTIEPFKFKSYKINTPLILENPIQVINQHNTLHFFGQEIPIKQRKKINSSFKFERFNITPILPEDVDTAYEYRFLELKTEVDEIRKIFSTLKETKNIKGINQFNFEELSFNHLTAKRLRELDRSGLEQDRRNFYDNWTIKQEDQIYKYWGQGQKDWQLKRDYEYEGQWMNTASSVASSVGSFTSNLLTGNFTGAFSSLTSAATQTYRTLNNPNWDIEERNRIYERDLNQKKLDLENKQYAASYGLKYERLATADRAAEFKERREIIAATNAIQLTDANEIHIHKALTKELNLNDVYMTVNYPDGWLLDKLRVYYDRYGFDVQIPDYILTENNLADTGKNIKFEYIDEINITDPLVREKISLMFIQGIRLRELPAQIEEQKLN